uniref:folate gamma-glutamyl hydrolase n=1 Tax=Lygus hesperus TaxID=30085 RepID=A0A146LWE9_LYGHE
MEFVQIFSCLLILQAINDEGDALLRTNDRPVIGILAQEYYPSKTEGGADGTYIAASYVKMVEASGARVVPIMTGKDRSYYQKLVKTLNGILFPGGGVDFWAKGGYGEASQILYELVIEVNEKGTHFPLYGVCLGFEAFAVASSNMSRDVLSKVEGVNNKAINLIFLPKKSSLYSKMPKQFLELLRSKNITSNHHSQSFTRESLRLHNLEQTWSTLTVNSDSNGTEFISSMEHVQYPQIFGTQFHPEKIPYEWTTKDPHSLEAILPNRYFYDYFVEHARYNDHKFRDGEVANLIYNYSPVYTPNGYFQQVYIFKDANDYVVEQVD